MMCLVVGIVRYCLVYNFRCDKIYADQSLLPIFNILVIKTQYIVNYIECASGFSFPLYMECDFLMEIIN